MEKMKDVALIAIGMTAALAYQKYKEPVKDMVGNAINKMENVIENKKQELEDMM